MPKLRGRIEFAAVPHAVSAGTLRVRLIDVSRAGAAASTLVEQVIPGVTIRSAADQIDFSLDVTELDPRRTYAIEAHLDAGGSGETAVGDYRTMEHFAVTPDTVDDGITVRLRPVT